MLLNKEKILTYAVANIYVMILICYIILFYFSLYEKIIIIPLVLSILIGISLVSYFKEEKPILNNILLYSTSGFVVGDFLMKLIFIYIKILNNIEIFIIIMIFTFIFNLFIFASPNKSYIICSSILFAYFVSELYIIGEEIKIPIITITNSLVEEGFEISMMKEFISKKYFIYYIIFFGALILILLLKLFVYKEKQTERIYLNSNFNLNEKKKFISSPSLSPTSRNKTSIQNDI